MNIDALKDFSVEKLEQIVEKSLNQADIQYITTEGNNIIFSGLEEKNEQ